MVFKSVQRIKEALPEVIHIAMFYNNGTIFQTTIEQNFNIPKLGEHIAEALNHLRKVYEICNFNLEEYKKLIFETENISIIILKLGEDSNLALFLKKEIDINQKLKSIRRYIKKIEELIDTDKADLEFQELEKNEDALKNLKVKLKDKQELIQTLEQELTDLAEETSKEKIKEISKQIQDYSEECRIISQEIEDKKTTIAQIKQKIEEERTK
ncbi:MAG: hypothetical protein EU548_09845 [Promethearchaeota archaeon]|nr:MAG: hypothetical protein EU548_09845 [Candidatus Lokiarchaeota archaeon]